MGSGSQITLHESGLQKRRHGTNPVCTCSVSSPVVLPTWCHVRHKTPPATCPFIIYNYCMHVFLHIYACGCAWWGWDSHRTFTGVRGQLLWSWRSPSILLAVEMKLMLAAFHRTHLACGEAPSAPNLSNSALCSCLPGGTAGNGALASGLLATTNSVDPPILSSLQECSPQIFVFCILNRGLM